MTNTSRLISFMETKNFTDLGLSLERDGRDLETYEGHESELPELNNEENELLDNLVMGWLEDKNLRFRYPSLNGLLYLENKELIFSGEAQDWVEVCV